MVKYIIHIDHIAPFDAHNTSSLAMRRALGIPNSNTLNVGGMQSNSCSFGSLTVFEIKKIN